MSPVSPTTPPTGEEDDITDVSVVTTESGTVKKEKVTWTLTTALLLGEK